MNPFYQFPSYAVQFMDWSMIKSSYNQKLFQISYFILIGLPIIIEIVNFINRKLGQSYKIPSTFLLIFFSSLFLGVSYIVYKMFCPEEIRTHNNVNSFLAAEQSNKEKAFLDKMKEIVVAHLASMQKVSRTKILELDKRIRAELDPEMRAQLENQLTKILNPLYPGCIQRYLIKEWDILERKNPDALVACAILNCISLIMVLFVFGHRIWVVIDYKF